MAEAYNRIAQRLLTVGIGDWRGVSNLLQCETNHQRFDHHDRTVNDDPEIDCAQRDQVCRNTPQVEHDERTEKRKGNYHGDNHGSAPVAEKYHQDTDDQTGPDQQILGHRVNRMIDQCGAVIDYLEARAARQFAVDRVDGETNVGNDRGRITALCHLDDAFDNGVSTVEGDNAGRLARARDDLRNVCHLHGTTVFCKNDGAADFIRGGEDALTAYDQRFVTAP